MYICNNICNGCTECHTVTTNLLLWISFRPLVSFKPLPSHSSSCRHARTHPHTGIAGSIWVHTVANVICYNQLGYSLNKCNVFIIYIQHPTPNDATSFVMKSSKHLKNFIYTINTTIFLFILVILLLYFNRKNSLQFCWLLK